MKQQNNKIISNKPFDGIKRSEKILNNSLSINDKISSNWFLESIKNSGLKLVTVVVVTVILSFSLSSVGSTVSYFNDLEVSFGNYLKADPLGFKVLIGGVNTAQVDLGSGETMFVPEMILNSDSEPIQYFVTSKITGGDSNLCNAINVMGTFPFPYDGKVAMLYTATSTQAGSWALSFTLSNSENFINSSCTMDLVYKGWNADSVYGSGYSDTQIFSITFFVPDVAPPPLIENLKNIVVQDEVVEATTTQKDLDESLVPNEEKVPVEEKPTPPAESLETKPEDVTPVIDSVVNDTPVSPTQEVVPEIPLNPEG